MKIVPHKRMMAFKEGHVKETTPFLFTMFELALEMKPDVIVEIGVHNAISSHAWLSALQHNGKGKLYGIDLIDFAYNIKDPELLKYFEFNKADSREFYKTWDKPIDILHIDGDHSYTVCKQDFENYYPFVKLGGYILIHDIIKWVGCTKFWDDIIDKKIFLPWYDGLAIIQKNGLEPKDVAIIRESLGEKLAGK